MVQRKCPCKEKLYFIIIVGPSSNKLTPEWGLSQISAWAPAQAYALRAAYALEMHLGL